LINYWKQLYNIQSGKRLEAHNFFLLKKGVFGFQQCLFGGNKKLLAKYAFGVVCKL